MPDHPRAFPNDYRVEQDNTGLPLIKFSSEHARPYHTVLVTLPADVTPEELVRILNTWQAILAAGGELDG